MRPPTGTVVGTPLYALDVDAGDRLSWTVALWGTGSSSFLSLSSSGTLSLLLSPNFERQSTYTLTARVSDRGGLFNDTLITVSVTNVNEVPVVAATGAGFLDENLGAGTAVSLPTSLCVYDEDDDQSAVVSVAPSSQFSVTAMPQGDGHTSCLSVTTTRSGGFNFEDPQTAFPVNVSCCDTGTPALCAYTILTVTINDVNESPFLNNTIVHVTDKSTAGGSG